MLTAARSRRPRRSRRRASRRSPSSRANTVARAHLNHRRHHIRLDRLVCVRPVHSSPPANHTTSSCTICPTPIRSERRCLFFFTAWHRISADLGSRCNICHALLRQGMRLSGTRTRLSTKRPSPTLTECGSSTTA